MSELRVATVLFTDLVGSTELSTQVGPVEADALRQTHFALLRGAIAANGGVEVKNLGDGLMVAFSTSSGALACAVAMQQALERHNRGAAHVLSVRIGLSHGEVTEEDGDYFGDAVVEAARLCAESAGGQILATQLVQLTSGRRASQDFGTTRDVMLKGFDEPVTVVEVMWSAAEDPGDGDSVPLPARCELTPDVGFIGRAGERSVLADAFKKVVAEERRRIVFVGGEPGMGKTSLSSEFARWAHQAGATVLYGRSDEDLGVPYQPWVEAMGHLATHAPPDVLSLMSRHAGSLVQLVPDLASQAATTSNGATGDQEAARFMLFGAVVDALRAAGGSAPVVVVLDDLQWADTPSLQLLRHIVSTTEPLQLLVVGTYRESEVDAAGPLAQVLAAGHREPGIERISLRGLDDTEVLALMESAAGQTLDTDGLTLRDALCTETDGNPFFVGELLRHLVEAGSIYQETDGRWVASGDLREQGLPVSVREVLGRRTARLGEDGIRVLSIASVIGRDFDLSLLSQVSGTDVAELLDLLDKATDAVLVSNVAGERYSFVHALIEHTIYDALSPARRAYLHGQVAEAMEAQDRGRDQPRVAELAYHWAQATVPENRQKAIDYARRAGDLALAKLAPHEAVRWYSQVLEDLGRGGPDDAVLHCQVQLGLGEAQRQLGSQQFRETLLEAATLAQRLGATDLLVRAALANSRGFSSIAGVVDTERVAVLEAAAATVAGAGSASEARVLGLLASELTYGDDFPRRRALAEQAVQIARGVGDPATLVRVICDAAQALQVPEMMETRLALSAEAFELARDLGDPVLLFWSAIFKSSYFMQRADLGAEGDEAAVVADEVAQRLGQPALIWVSTFGLASRALQTGDLERAEELSNRALGIAQEMGEADGVVVYGAQLMALRFMQGRSNEVLDVIREAAVANPGLPGFWAALALLLAEDGLLDEAGEAIRHVVTPEGVI
ncbi:MAG TPA: AAA family ATPase, partial [Acidimicrobiales bacterium]|nr:AAA family ATPase [Acidimicrobiales bacterium]